MAESRVYTSLKFRDSFRVLNLTRPRSEKHQLQGQLVPVRLKDKPRYVALSYVWGSQTTPDHYVRINGQLHGITGSLLEALEGLTPFDGTISVWVDQISINQKDEVEKQHQVWMMGRIFGQAERVVGWLGSSDENSESAMQLFRVLSAKDEGDQRDEILRDLVDMQDVVRSRAMDMSNPAHLRIKAVVAFLRRPWFRRLWIAQEVVLADKFELRCGRNSISAQGFFDAVEALCSIVSDPPVVPYKCLFWYANRLGLLRSDVHRGEPQDLLHLASVLSRWECKDDRDRLNALVAITGHTAEGAGWFKPSYAGTAEVLFRAFAVMHVKGSRSLRILNFAGRATDTDISILAGSENSAHGFLLPSWVPDWLLHARPIPLTRHSNSHDIFSSTSSYPSFDIDGSKLHVRALEVDRIRACGSPYNELWCRSRDRDAYELFIEWWQLAMKELPGEDINTVFASTLSMDGKIRVIDCQGLSMSTDEIPTLFKHWAARYASELKLDSNGTQAGLDEATRFGNMAEEVCRDRRFFITESGRLGLGPMSVSPGSSIYLIHGLSTPFVVEDYQGGQVLRGECFVHGLMYGQVPTSDQDTTLCLI